MVEKDSGIAFDPRVVEVLARRYVELERKAKSGGGSGEKAKLSTDLKIERGAAPAAGFEATGKIDETGLDLMKIHRSISIEQIDATIEALGQCADRDQAFALLRNQLRSLIPYDALAIYQRDGDALHPAFLDGDEFNLFSSLEIPLGSGLSGWVAENHKPIVNGNPSVEPGYLNDPTKFSTLRSALAVPLESRRGNAGVLSLYHQGRDAFTEQDCDLLLNIGSILARAMEKSPASKESVLAK